MFAIILTTMIFIAHALSSFLEKMVVSGLWYGWILLFLWYLFFMFIGIVIGLIAYKNI